MLFNSIEYALFLPIILGCYWLLFKKNRVYQNILLLTASYYFYACWDYRFLALLIFSTLLDFYTGLKINIATSAFKRKIWLITSVSVNLGFLCFFKYYNFFVDSFANLLVQFGLQPSYNTLNIILPIGISFYTFHGLSYVFDIYNRKINATNNFIDYSLFVSFFPLLVAGPIERATHLLPQIKAKRVFNAIAFANGMRQILWGLFKKIVVADTCAQYVDPVFQNYTYYDGGSLLIASILFLIQLYGDFSGYTDIALGSARLLGFELLQNFRYPFFSTSIKDFWARWHISLSTWFKDYLYIPLGGSKQGKLKWILNLIIVFALSGLWHGASFNRIIWGLLFALYLIPSVFLNKHYKSYKNNSKDNSFYIIPSFKELVSIIYTFLICTLIFIFFRTSSLSESIFFYTKIFTSLTQGSLLQEIIQYWKNALGWTPIFLIFILFIAEWLGRFKSFTLEHLQNQFSTPIRWIIYFVLILLLFLYASHAQQFIYFQF